MSSHAGTVGNRQIQEILRHRSISIRKLAQLDAAQALEFLRSPPGNRLQALKGNRQGQYSIRINGQFRVCFHWTKEGPEAVAIVDYH